MLLYVGEYLIVKKKENIEGFSIFTHELVPKHEIINQKEADSVLSQYHIKPFQLPFILSSDPSVQEIQGKPGDVVKITRKSPTAGECIVYRYIVEG